MTKTLGYTGSSGWVGWVFTGSGGSNQIEQINVNNTLTMPETGYITAVHVYAAGNGAQVDSEIFVATTSGGTTTFPVDIYCKLPVGSQSAGGQSWNTVTPGSPPLITSGTSLGIGLWRSTTESLIWSYQNVTNWQWDDGVVGTAPSAGGGVFGTHNLHGGQALGAYIDYTPAAPILNSFSPSNGVVGTTITVSGAALQAVSAVNVNGVAASFSIASDSSLSLVIPSGATTGNINVTNPYGTTAIGTLTVNYPPTISGLSPTGAGVGQSVVITGTYFNSVSSVDFNGTAATSYTVNSSTQITATVPAGATTGPIHVVTPWGTATSATFTVYSARAYDGTAWQTAIPYCYDGSAFQVVQIFIYDGTSWVQSN